MAQCKDCYKVVIFGHRGNGQCSSCFGRGTKNTIVNDISGSNSYCPQCKGSGHCRTCNGTGVIDDPVLADTAPPRPSQASMLTRASDTEGSWYRFCDEHTFLRESTVAEFVARLKAEGKVGAIAVGLHPFAEQSCPRCGAKGHYKLHFLGRLQHPECGTSWYVAPSWYIPYQVCSVMHTGIRAGSSLKQAAKRKGERSGTWVEGMLGFMMAAILRAVLAAVLIPLQAVVSLSQSKPSRAASTRTAKEPAA